jgi:hypothetical protein
MTAVMSCCSGLQKRDKMAESLAAMPSEQAIKEEELRVNAELNQLKVQIIHLEKAIEGYQVNRRIHPSEQIVRFL